jgi:hypothetical protein
MKIPPGPTATHNDPTGCAHETDCRPPPAAMVALLHDAGPAVGALELTTAPAVSTPTHSEADGQERLTSREEAITLGADQ